MVSHCFIARLGGPDHAVVIAHCGASADAPENTLAAIELAITADADWIEIDVQESRDGEMIVAHGTDFRRVGKSQLKVRDATRAELDEIDIGSWFDPKFSDQRPPTLRDVLTACKDRAGLLIEPKQMSGALSRGVDGLITDRPALARRVLQERAELNPAERLLIDLAARFGKAPPQHPP